MLTNRSGLVAVLGAALIWMPSCTTLVRPTICDRDSTACGGIHDARFCDYIAVSVEGADCSLLGIVETKHFCVVTAAPCSDTNYAVKDRDCAVLRYQPVSDSFRADCAPGTPMFVNQ